ncbi:class C beta-lactamase [Thalassotalea euphylliae]|uniref:class C beta-lactamase n=1 Tax=Thalassotalea euphylliae TaxID=1655234 RepID=UPI003636E62E
MFDVKRCLLNRVAAIFVIALGGYSQLSNAAEKSSVSSLVDKLIPELMTEYEIPGVAVAITHEGNDYLYEFGVQDEKTGTPVTEHTLFEVGSISKLFTATLAAKAEVQGMISLDKPIATYADALTGTPLGKVPVFHLATHTAGGFPLQLPGNIESYDSLTKYYQNWAPQFPEGTRRSYANPSIGLLGILTASAQNAEFVALMDKELFRPIGLNNTYIEVPDTEFVNYAWGKSRQGKNVRVTPAVLANEAYGIKTTNQDLLQFLKLHLLDMEKSNVMRKAALATHKGYFDTGPYYQALVWEKYPFPVDPCSLKKGNSYKMIFESGTVKTVASEKKGYENYLLSKTGATNGFGAYVIAVPHRKFAMLLLANKNYSMSARIETAYNIMSEVLSLNTTYCEKS